MLIDTHAHLDHRNLAADLPDVLARARAAGVGQWVAPATDLDSARALIALAATHPGLHACAGIHPCDSDSVVGDDWVQTLHTLASTAGIAAIGEIGLDYYHNPPEGFDAYSWKAQQARVPVITADVGGIESGDLTRPARPAICDFFCHQVSD